MENLILKIRNKKDSSFIENNDYTFYKRFCYYIHSIQWSLTSKKANPCEGLAFLADKKV